MHNCCFLSAQTHVCTSAFMHAGGACPYTHAWASIHMDVCTPSCKLTNTHWWRVATGVLTVGIPMNLHATIHAHAHAHTHTHCDVYQGRAALPRCAIITGLNGRPTPDLASFASELRKLPHAARVPLEFYTFGERYRQDGLCSWTAATRVQPACTPSSAPLNLQLEPDNLAGCTDITLTHTEWGQPEAAACLPPGCQHSSAAALQTRLD